MNIVLIGIMGSGKSSVGKALAKSIGYGFLDMDRYIEQKNETTIPEMFKISEDFFREKELEAASIVGKYDRTVIATGGGVVKNSSLMDMLKQNGVIVYIRRDVSTILETANTDVRPVIADDPQRLYKVMEERKHLYEKYGEIIVNNKTTVKYCVEKIISRLKERDFEI